MFFLKQNRRTFFNILPFNILCYWYGLLVHFKVSDFWQNGQTAFFDIRVTHVNATSSKQKSCENIYRDNENSKKREYLQRVIDVEHSAFTPLVFGTNGGMGRECHRFLSNLSEKL